MTEQPRSQSGDRTRSLRANTAVSLAPRVVTIVVAFALSPYIVHHVGLAAFGYWSVVLAVLQFVQIADGGLPVVTARAVARARARQDLDELRSAVAITAVALLGLGAIVVIGGFLVPRALPVGVTRGLPSGWQAAASAAGIALALTMIGNGLAAVTRGWDRWDIDAAISSAGQLAGAATTVVLLELGGGLASLGVAACVMSGVMLVGYGVAAGRRGALAIRRVRFRRDLVREFRQQGTHLQIVAVVAATNAQADRFMLLPFASLSWIGAYALGARVAVALRSFPMSAFGPLMIRISNAETSGGAVAVRSVYQRALTAITRFGLPGLVVAYAAIFPGTLAWLGSDFTISATAALVLGLGYAVNIATGPGTVAAIACGRAELDRNYSLLGLALNLSLSAALGLLVGPWGVVAATTAGLAISSLWLLHTVDRWLEIRAMRIALGSRDTLIQLISALGLSTATVLGASLAAPLDRWQNALLALLASAIGLTWLGRAEIVRRGRAIRPRPVR
jgi:O-antigen/teichoic acid export membrane protein